MPLVVTAVGCIFSLLHVCLAVETKVSTAPSPVLCFLCLQHSLPRQHEEKLPLLPPALSPRRAWNRHSVRPPSLRQPALSHKTPLFPALRRIHILEGQLPTCSLSRREPCQQTLAHIKVHWVLALQKYPFPLWFLQIFLNVNGFHLPTT